MDLGLSGLVVFVTGASGGIGAALVEAFLAEGALVAAHSRRGVSESERVGSFVGDVRDAAGQDAAMRAAVARFGRVDVAIANAGIWPPDHVTLDVMDEARVREVVETNLLGAMWTARAFLAALRRSGPREDGRGSGLVFVGSTAGRFGEAGHAEYAATKAALVGLVKSLKNEIATIDPRGRANLVEPGWTVTAMAAETLAREGVVERVTRTMPLRKLATPGDVARAAVVLASPVASGHVSGEAVLVAGGMEGRLLW